MAFLEGVAPLDGKRCQEVTELIRDTKSPRLFYNSSRVYYFDAFTGQRGKLKFDSELLYIEVMFHDIGLTPKHSSKTERFVVDGTNTYATSCAAIPCPSGYRHCPDRTRFPHHARHPRNTCIR